MMRKGPRARARQPWSGISVGLSVRLSAEVALKLNRYCRARRIGLNVPMNAAIREYLGARS